MEKYLIELPHTDVECLKALDETKVRSLDLLPLIDWGCTVGKHSGYVFVEANSDLDARKRIQSPYLSSTALVTKVVKFSEQQIESFHKM